MKVSLACVTILFNEILPNSFERVLIFLFFFYKIKSTKDMMFSCNHFKEIENKMKSQG